MNYTCIGAKDRIFDHFLSRNSDPTIPRKRQDNHRRNLFGEGGILDNLVPIGSPFLLMSTHALSSNLIRLPSFLCTSFFARTTTACRMSPRRTLFAMPKLEPPGFSGPKDLCFCTTTMIRSPAQEVSLTLRKVKVLSLSGCTDCRMLSLLSHHRNTLDNGGPGIVDAIKHRLDVESVS